jgi:hypothetical protein
MARIVTWVNRQATWRSRLLAWRFTMILVGSALLVELSGL